jgi:hypothetical protein
MSTEDKSSSEHDENSLLIGPDPQLINHNRPGVLEKTAAMYIAHFKLDSDAKCRDLRVNKPKAKPKSKTKAPTSPKEATPKSAPMDEDEDDLRFLVARDVRM